MECVLLNNNNTCKKKKTGTTYCTSKWNNEEWALNISLSAYLYDASSEKFIIVTWIQKLDDGDHFYFFFFLSLRRQILNWMLVVRNLCSVWADALAAAFLSVQPKSSRGSKMSRPRQYSTASVVDKTATGTFVHWEFFKRLLFRCTLDSPEPSPTVNTWVLDSIVYEYDAVQFYTTVNYTHDIKHVVHRL